MRGCIYYMTGCDEALTGCVYLLFNNTIQDFSILIYRMATYAVNTEISMDLSLMLICIQYNAI